MKKLLELEATLRKAREELEKNAQMGYGNDAATGMPSGTADVNMAKEEDCADDEKKDKKMIDEKMDEHNEKEHGEPKDEDSAKKSETVGVSNQNQPLVKFHPNGQWSLNKVTQMDAKPNGEFDVPVKEVYDGDDDFVHVGNRGVDGDDKGKTDKLADKEKDLLKD